MNIQKIIYTAILRTHNVRDQLQDGLIAQLVEHCTGRGHEFESRSGVQANFFQALIPQLLKLRA